MNHGTEDQADHWQRVYSTRRVEEMSWTEARPDASLALIDRAELPKDAAILDVGGGTSRFADELLQAGYRDVSVADISPAALERARAELEPDAQCVTWIAADVRTHDFARKFDLWHDRAVLHFMVERSDRDAYRATLERSLKPGGRVILATFGPNGPTECSGLPVERYDAEGLARLLGGDYELTDSRVVEHRTPSGKTQQFTYVLLTRSANPRDQRQDRTQPS
ncbi:MAG: class I SAM-dependent methyltransferase [Solirubrobacterales bacterium]